MTPEDVVLNQEKGQMVHGERNLLPVPNPSTLGFLHKAPSSCRNNFRTFTVLAPDKFPILNTEPETMNPETHEQSQERRNYKG